MPTDDPNGLLSLVPEGGAVVAILVCVWVFAKFVTQTQAAHVAMIEKLGNGIDGLRSETAQMRTEVAKLADAVNDFRGGRRNIEGG